MIAVISGDIINSKSIDSSKLVKTLKDFLKQYGSSPRNWEVFRGDQFQLELTKPEEAFLLCVKLKALIKQLGNVDVRIAIGIGEKTYNAPKITQSNGSAFVHSGRKFDLLKKDNNNLAIQTDDEIFDVEMNLFFRFALVFMDEWSAVSCEIVHTLLSYPKKKQFEIAVVLGINQSAVSQRIKRANIDLLKDLNSHYISRVKQLLQ